MWGEGSVEVPGLPIYPPLLVTEFAEVIVFFPWTSYENAVLLRVVCKGDLQSPSVSRTLIVKAFVGRFSAEFEL